MPGSRITVSVDGESGGLQAALAKAVEALSGLGDELKKQTAAAVAQGDRTITSNDKVAASFQRAAAKATSSSREMAVRYSGAADEQVAASNRIVAALERATGAAASAAAEQSAAATKMGEAADRVATAAVRSAQRQVTANDRAANSATRAAQTSEAAARRSEAAFGSSSSHITKLGRDTSLGILGIGTASVVMATKFQANTTRLQTQAEASARQVSQLRVGLLKMANEVGYTPDQLADGMYHVVSSMNKVLPAAQRVSAELHIMKIGAEGAQIGHANLEDTTYALASAMNALHDRAADAGKVMGQLNSIVGTGDMTMQDLLDAFKSGVVPAAKEAGISLQSLGGAMAVMGDMGIRGSLAGTRLRMAIALLSAPSGAAAKVLNTLGLTSKQATSTSEAMSKALEKAGLRTTQLSGDLHKPDGILVALRDLNDHLQKSGLTATGAAAVMNKAFGGARSGTTITALAQNTGRLAASFRQVGVGARNFGGDWQTTSHTLQVQLKQIEGGAASLGIELGDKLIPKVEDFIGDMKEMVHWFEQNHQAVHALEGIIATFATVTIGSYFVSKVRQALTLLKELRSVATTPFKAASWLESIGKSTTGPAGGGAAGRLASTTQGMGIGGAKSGYGLPGSIANPIIVAMEAGEYAGLGSQGAAGTVSTEAEKEGAKVSTAAGAAEGAVGAETEGGAAAAILGSVKSGLGTVLGSLLRGGAVAGGGVAASQLVGHLVGGGTGRTITTLGTGASIGAGIGTAIEPGLGTAIGAAGGVGVAEAVKLLKGKSYGAKIADSLTTGFGGESRKQLQGAIASELNDAHDLLQKQVAKAGSLTEGTPLTFKGPTAKDITAASTKYRQAGTMVAQQLEAGWSSYKFQSEPVMLSQFKAEIKGLPPQAQAAAAQSAVQFAAGLSNSGRLPAQAAANMLVQIENQFPALDKYMGTSASESVRDFTAALDLSPAAEKVQNQIHQISGDFPQIGQAMASTSGTVEDKANAVIGALARIATTGTTPMRRQAAADLQAVQQSMQTMNVSATSDLTQMAGQVVSKTKQMSVAIETGSSTAAKAAYTNLGQFATNVEAAMSQGVTSTGQGMNLIISTTNKALKEMGQKQLTPIQVASMQITVGKQAQLAAHNAAAGFIGTEGERGRDNVLINAGRGEAVLNHQQQSIVNGALAATGVGSLANVFQNTAGSRHYMATGGFVGGLPRGRGYAGGGFVVGASEFGGPNDASTHGSDSGAYGTDVTGSIARLQSGGGYFDRLTPGSKWTITAPTGKSITSTVTDLGSGGGSVDGHPRAIDLWWQTANALGLPGTGGQWTGLLTVTPAGVAGSTPTAAGLTPQVTAPTVKGTSPIASVTRGAVDQVTQAANTYLSQQIPSVTVTGGGGGAGPVAAPPKGPMPPAVQKALFAAQTIAGRGEPYVWGGYGFNAPGLDCSGYVSTVMDYAGLMNGYLTTVPLKSWGVAGDGKWITVGVWGGAGEDGHTMMAIDGKYFESGGGPLGPHRDAGWSQDFPVRRHPPGLAAGGMVGDFGQVPPAVLLKNNPTLRTNPNFIAYARKHGMSKLAVGGAVSANAAPGLERPMTTKPKVKNVPRAKLLKIPKVKNLKAPPAGFESTAESQINALNNTISTLSGSWSDYILGLHGGGKDSAEAIVTLADGTDVINWNGMIDPNTGEWAKGINQRLTEIGVPGNTDIHTELGIQDVLLTDNQKVQSLAASAVKQMPAWWKVIRGDQEAWSFVTASDVQQENWLKAMLQEQVPFSSITVPGQTSTGLAKYKPMPGRPMAKLQTAPGGGDWYEWIVGYLQAIKDSIAQAARNRQVQTDLEQGEKHKTEGITMRFEKARHDVTVAGLKSRFSTNQLLSTQIYELEQERAQDLAGVPSSKPKDWKGSAKGWDDQARGERADINQRYDSREQAIRQAVSGGRFRGQLDRTNALFALTIAEQKEKLAAGDEYSTQRGALSGLISRQDALASNDTTYLGHLKTNLGTKHTADNKWLTTDNSLIKDVSSPGGFASQLQGYVAPPPMGALATAILTIQNINIPALLSEISQLTGTTIPPTTAASTDLSSLESQLATMIAEGNALKTVQDSVLRGMLALIPSYDKGGPIVRDTLAMVHEDEYVVPKGGALIHSGGNNTAPTPVHLEQHFHGTAGALVQMMDQRFDDPQNVMKVSQHIGRRTRMLRR